MPFGGNQMDTILIILISVILSFVINILVFKRVIKEIMKYIDSIDKCYREALHETIMAFDKHSKSE